MSLEQGRQRAGLPVARRDHHRDRRIRVGRSRLQSHPVFDLTVRDGARPNGATTQVFVHRPGLQLVNPLFLRGIERDASRDRSPVVEDTVDVADPIGSLRHPQQQLEVLDPVEGRIKTSGLADQVATGDEQVPDVHRAEGVDRGPVGLQKGVGAPPPLGDLVLVRVGDVDLRLAERARHVQQRVRGEGVVVVEKGDELATALFDRMVRGGGDTRVPVEHPDHDSLIASAPARQLPVG